MAKQRLQEKATFELKGSKVVIRLINEGKGSSGFYAAEMLEKFGATAFPKGTHLYYNHVEPENRDVRDAFGVLAEDAKYNADEKALIAEAEIFTEHQQRVKDLAPHMGMSIEAAGDKDDEGNVVEILADPFNAVAMVTKAGRGGAITGILESFKPKDKTNREDRGMTPEEIQKLAEELAKALAPVLTEALKPVEPEKPDNGEEDKGPDALVVAEALVAADLPKAARARVMEAVKTGIEVEKAVESEKSYIEEIQKGKEDVGTVITESAKDEYKPAISLNVDGWN